MLKNIQQTQIFPAIPELSDDVSADLRAMREYAGNLQRYLEDYARNISDNIVEKNRYDDLRFDATALRVSSTAPPTLGDFLAAGNIKCFRFSNVTDNFVHFGVQIPHSVRKGTKLKPHVHYSPITADTGTVCWALEYSWANIKAGQEKNFLFPASTTIRTVNSVGGVAWEHLIAEFDEIDIPFDISCMLMCALYRDVSEDNYGASAALLEFDIHVEIDSLGSREEFRK